MTETQADRSELERVRSRLREYFNTLEGLEKSDPLSAAGKWRMSCFESGLGLASAVEEDYFELDRKIVYDAAGAWGGHALAFSLSGCKCYISDLIDHEYAQFRDFIKSGRHDIHPFLADCMSIPLPDSSADVVIGLELVEHIPSVEKFAAEVARVLRPKGVAIISTPARLKSVYEGEPHYGIKGLPLLPFRLQKPVATKLFKKEYPYPIERQYLRAADVIKPFAACGLVGRSYISGRFARISESRPLLQKLVKQFFWRYIIVQKP